MKDYSKIRVGVIGVGGRGRGLTMDIMVPLGAKIVAICDNYQPAIDKMLKLLEEKGQPKPDVYTDYKELLASDKVDAVVIATPWKEHIRMAIDSMKAKKYTAFEVGGAYSLEECFELVKTYEETKTECMMLENCCFGRDELLVLNMVRQGLFGKVIHCQGGYRHDLRDEVSFGRENHHYRFNEYLTRNRENYPTHELGPIANVLNINHGNRMVSLVSMASASIGLHEFLLEKKGEEYDATHFDFKQGDVVTTIIKCEQGQTITLTLDTTLPRPYSRGFHVQGTKGIFDEDNKSIFLDSMPADQEWHWDKHWGNVKDFYDKYDDPLWGHGRENFGSHGGMDSLEFIAFFNMILAKGKSPIDVYDAASWMAISTLSEESIKNGSAPVEIPDFTHGEYKNRKPWVSIINE